MNIKRMLPTIGGVLALLAGGALVFLWVFCRVDVDPDEMVVLIRKTGDPLPPDQVIAEQGQKGIQRAALGPGLYFLNPLAYETEKYPLVEVPAGDPSTWRETYRAGRPDYQVPDKEGAWPKVGVVKSLAGKTWDGPSGVVDPGFQGIQREVLTPGTYRLNPRAFQVELHDAVVVPLGCCGVVTSLLGETPGVEEITETIIGPDGEPVEGETKVVQKLASPGQRGVLKQVFPPGIYYLNPYVHKVKIVQVGYNELSQLVTDESYDEIRFPSRDGFTITVDVTVVWGRHPEHSPEMIARFGEVDKLQQIVLGQIRSICRNIGSGFDSTDFIRGEKREEYQQAITDSLREVARQRDIEILIALIQDIEVQGGTPDEGDEDLKSTIQRRYIAKEEELTRQQQREAAKIKAELETAKADIEVAREQITADTRKKVAEILAEGNKAAEEIDAQRDLEVARIERQIAELDAERTRVLGRAEAEVEELRNQADASGRRLMVEAFGTGRAYNLYTFAEKFEPDDIRLFFAGDGTFWTDLNRLQDAASLELLRTSEAGRNSDASASDTAGSPRGDDRTDRRRRARREP